MDQRVNNKGRGEGKKEVPGFCLDRDIQRPIERKKKRIGRAILYAEYHEIKTNMSLSTLCLIQQEGDEQRRERKRSRWNGGSARKQKNFCVTRGGRGFAVDLSRKRIGGRTAKRLIFSRKNRKERTPLKESSLRKISGREERGRKEGSLPRGSGALPSSY